MTIMSSPDGTGRGGGLSQRVNEAKIRRVDASSWWGRRTRLAPMCFLPRKRQLVQQTGSDTGEQ